MHRYLCIAALLCGCTVLCCQEGDRYPSRKGGSCKEYYECRDGREVLHRCLECQNYDVYKKECDYVFNSPCISMPPTPATIPGPTEPSTKYGTTSHTLPVPTSSPGGGEPNQNSATTPESRSIPEHLPSTETSAEDVTSEPATADPLATPSGHDINPVPATSSDSVITNFDPIDPTGQPATEPTPKNVPTETPPSSSPIEPTFCKKVERRGLQHSCKNYLECENGELVTKKCGWFQYFDSESNTCAYTGYTCFESQKRL